MKKFRFKLAHKFKKPVYIFNRNERIYPKEVLQKAIKDYNSNDKNKIILSGANKVFGELKYQIIIVDGD